MPTFIGVLEKNVSYSVSLRVNKCRCTKFYIALARLSRCFVIFLVYFFGLFF